MKHFFTLNSCTSLVVWDTISLGSTLGLPKFTNFLRGITVSLPHPILSIANSFVIDSPSILWLLVIRLNRLLFKVSAGGGDRPSGAVYFYLSLILLLICIVLLYFSLLDVSYSEGINDLPVILEFKNLHLTESLKSAKESLNGASGIYCLANQETGSMYIGSSVNLYGRLYDHVMNYGSNLHLQRALLKFGLAALTFKILEQCTKDSLLFVSCIGWTGFSLFPLNLDTILTQELIRV